MIIWDDLGDNSLVITQHVGIRFCMTIRRVLFAD